MLLNTHRREREKEEAERVRSVWKREGKMWQKLCTHWTIKGKRRRLLIVTCITSLLNWSTCYRPHGCFVSAFNFFFSISLSPRCLNMHQMIPLVICPPLLTQSYQLHYSHIIHYNLTNISMLCICLSCVNEETTRSPSSCNCFFLYFAFSLSFLLISLFQHDNCTQSCWWYTLSQHQVICVILCFFFFSLFNKCT